MFSMSLAYAIDDEAPLAGNETALLTDTGWRPDMAANDIQRNVWTVYLITCSVTGRRYVGLTKQTTRQRLAAHRHSVKAGKTAIARAMRKYGGATFSIKPLASALSHEDAAAIEVILIAEHGTRSPHGYNLTDGGEGTKGRFWTEEEKERSSPRQKGHPKSEEHRRKIAETLSGRTLPEAHRANIAASGIGRVTSDETKAKLSAIHSGREMSAEWIAKLSEAARRPEVIAKKPQNQKGRVITPEHHANIIKATSRPEYRELRRQIRLEELRRKAANDGS